MQQFITRTLLVSLLLLGLAAMVVAPVHAEDDSFADDNFFVGAVFVGTNHNNTNVDDILDSTEPANRVVMYLRSRDGRLFLFDSFATGGRALARAYGSPATASARHTRCSSARTAAGCSSPMPAATRCRSFGSGASAWFSRTWCLPGTALRATASQTVSPSIMTWCMF